MIAQPGKFLQREGLSPHVHTFPKLFNSISYQFLCKLQCARISKSVAESLPSLVKCRPDDIEHELFVLHLDRGSSYLVNRITAEPTFGRGIKQFGGTFATI